MKKLASILILTAILTGCQAKTCQPSGSEQSQMTCSAPVPAKGNIYETWSPKDGYFHEFFDGLSFDPGDAKSEKYLERHALSQWVEPELITAETAEKEKFSWAGNRNVRWLASTAGTLHFPLYPDEWDGDLYVETSLRPKLNPSMAVRFYKPDGNGGRVWSEPLTTDLTPGYHGYRWKIPKEYLSKDGMQLMRVSFPGSYFEGENRVSAKFVHFAIKSGNLKTGKIVIEPKMEIPEKWRVLDQELEGYGLRINDHIERFFVAPDNAMLEFYTAPGAWADDSGKLSIQIQTEREKKTVAEIAVVPGNCWKHQQIPLTEYANEAIRVIFSYIPDNPDIVFSQTAQFHPNIYISSPQIVIADDSLKKTEKDLFSAKRIVILAIDNLRGDRLWNENKRRATVHLSRLSDDGILGILMGEGKNFVAMETSMITGVPATTHNVYEPNTFVRTSLNTLAEAGTPNGWKSHFYTTSSIIDTTHGFAQGFEDVRALNKENITNTADALEIVTSAIKKSPEKSLFYIHLSELRLPHRSSDETFNQFAVPGYSGPVNEAAMNNIAVLRDPGKLDSEQFEAYYDAELYEMDESIGKFASELDSETLLVIYGTHGTSLGESTLGYEQGITPWELLTPFVIYMPEHHFEIRRQGIASASDLSATVREILGADPEPNTQSVLTLHNSRTTADSSDGLTATASMKYFYRIRREGVFAMFTTGLDGSPAHKEEASHPITEQALREQIK